MQQASSTILNILRNGTNSDPSAPFYTPLDLVEFYDHDYIPDPVTGFDAADALQTFSLTEVTWNGEAYRRNVVTRSDINLHIGQQANTVTITFSNIDKFIAAWAKTVNIEGMWMVIRIIEESITNDYIRCFVFKAGKPSTINLKSFTITADQELIDPAAELPLRSFTAQDPEGRTPDDPLYEGIRLVAVAGSFQYPTIIPARNTIARLFGQRDTVFTTKQWSSLDSTPYGQPIREVLGRAQIELTPFIWADKGTQIAALWAACAGPIQAMQNIKTRTQGWSDPVNSFNIPPAPPEIHLGDLGGTGTNASDPLGWPTAGFFSHLAYVSASTIGSTLEIEDTPPSVTAIILGRKVPVPNTSGVYPSILVEAGLEWTDNPVHLARWIFLVSGVDEAFLEDSINYLTSLWCDEPLLDESNSERVFIPNADIPQTGGTILRVGSTGRINSRSIRLNLGDTVDESWALEPGDYEPYEPGTPIIPTDIPTTFTTRSLYRKRYTFNAPITERVKSGDFLYKVLYPAFRGYHIINAKGKLEVKSEKAEDNCRLRASVLAGVSALPVDDVTPWKTNNLLQGRLHISFSLTTSENRIVSSAVYSADGNLITLVVGDTGGVTATASGGTLSGGSTTVQASGTITISGTPAAGDTVTATINGEAVIYTVDSFDTTASIAGMLAAAINANTTLKNYIRATFAGSVVTVQAKYGVLNLSSALALPHSSGEECIRIAMAFATNTQGAAVLAQAGLTRGNMVDYNYPLGSEQSSVNQIKGSFRDAANDFALTPFSVKDFDHYDRVKRWKILEIDYSGVDNWHQVYRLANSALAKNGDAGWLDSLTTGTAEALLLDPGDLKTCSDDSSEIINVLTRIESLSITPSHEVKINKARLYSTLMFSDEVVQRDIPIPSTLKYVQTVDTQFIPMDLPYWRDTDPINTPGFHVPYNRSIDAGDWRGTIIQSDATGAYVPVTGKLESRVPMGEALTALDATTNTHTFDTVSTVRVQITTPAESGVYQLQSTTEEKVLAGANKFALGINGRWEIGQFKTATLVGGTTDTFDLTFLLRGRFGTEEHVSDHAIADSFVLLTDHDGNDTGVVFIPLDLRLLNRTFNLKAVTTNQDIADATAQSFEWAGQSLTPLSTINHKGTRGSTDALLIEFEGRTRIGGGVRSNQGGATNEETEEYMVDIRSADGSTSKRVMPVSKGTAMSAVLESNSPAGRFTFIFDNSLTLPSIPDEVWARSLQKIEQAGNHVEAILSTSTLGTPKAGLGFMRASGDWQSMTLANVPLLARLEYSGSYFVKVYEYGVLKVTKAATSPVKVRLIFSGTEVRVVLNWTGAGTPPIHAMSVPPTFPVMAIATALDTNASVDKVMMTTDPFPKTVYSVSQQIADFGSTQSSVVMDIWQTSKTVGEGVKTRVTL